MAARTPHVVVVDPRFESYSALIESAQAGRVSLHLRSSGEEALRMAEKRAVDAWIVAADLEDMSGQDFIRLLRSRMEGRCQTLGLDRVALASEGTSEQWKALEQGADCGLSKPISLSSLECFLDMTAAEREMLLPGRDLARTLLTLPLNIGAAAMAIAVVLAG